MASIFDGVAAVLSDPVIFGAQVIYRPAADLPRSVASIFRRRPTEAEDSTGHPVLVMAPTWRVRQDLVPEIARGDRIEPGDGKVYEIMNVQHSGSPAADAFVVCELYEVEP